MTNSEITAEFIMDIFDGKYTKSEVERKVKEYEAKYGSDFFADYGGKKKDKPWDREYLNELKIKSMTGMTSKQFILYIAEVSEYVYSHEKPKKKKSKLKFIIAGAAAGIIVALVIAILCLSKKNASAMAIISHQRILIDHLTMQLESKLSILSFV